jgi:hypothetical protein
MLTTAHQLKRLKVGASMTLTGATYHQRNALYQVAYRAGIKISIRHTPGGVTLWRIK